MVPPNTSHYSLKNKIDFVFTNWGNIAMDLALLDIKVLNTHQNGRFSHLISILTQIPLKNTIQKFKLKKIEKI